MAITLDLAMCGPIAPPGVIGPLFFKVFFFAVGTQCCYQDNLCYQGFVAHRHLFKISYLTCILIVPVGRYFLKTRIGGPITPRHPSQPRIMPWTLEPHETMAGLIEISLQRTCQHFKLFAFAAPAPARQLRHRRQLE